MCFYFVCCFSFFVAYDWTQTIAQLGLTWHCSFICIVDSFFLVDFKQVNWKRKRSKQYQFDFSWLLAFIVTRWTIVQCAIELYSNFKNKFDQVLNYLFLVDFFVKIKKMFVFLSVLLATIVVYFLRFHYEFARAFYMSLKITGPPALPLIGNGLLFINNSSAGMNRFQKNFCRKKNSNYFHRLTNLKIPIFLFVIF